jgi:murein L,D-transpeptidase YcbB/YkuD
MSQRVQQIDDSLERWRWLPNEYVNAPLMVNLPEFVLRGYTDEDGQKHKLDFTMKVVVGKALGEHDTPVFTHMMKYLIFRPFWNVPTSIIKKELTGHIEKSGVGYLASHNFETVDNAGHVVQASAAQVEHFGVNVREKPGPKNSLGLVKFMFPNEYDIYLHSTPQPELFERTRRDFSHGCVRVQKPADLAVWVLAHGGVDDGWDLDKVTDAMQNGPDNHQVNLKTPIPIVIFYLTANVADDGEVHFFDDIYGYDKELDAVLAKGMPYPSTQQKVNPKASPEGTQ